MLAVPPMPGVPVLAWIDRSAGLLARWLLARPGRGFAWLVGLHMALWWLVLVVSQPNLPLDVIEIYGWSQNPGWATHKLPPLTVWLFWLFDHAGLHWQPIVQLQAPLAWGLMAWAIWRLGLLVSSPGRALLAVVLLEAVGHLTFAAALFNQNTVQLPFWALTALFVWQGLSGGRLRPWLLAGLCAALGMLGKYFIVFLLAAILLFLVLEPAARRVWRTPGPYLGALLGALLLTPHVLSVANDFAWQPLHYALDRAVDAGHWSDHLLAPLGWLLAQASGILGGLLALLLLWRRPGGEELLPAAELAPLARRYIAVVAGGPLLLCLLASAVTGSRFVDLWGMPLWVFLGLAGVLLPSGAITARPLARALALVVVLGGGSLVLHLGWLASPLVLKEPSRELFPGPALAAAAAEAWHAEVGQEAAGARAPAYLIGSFWLAGNIAYYGDWADSDVFVNGLLPNSPWVKPARLRREGALAVWRIGGKAGEGDAPPPWLDQLVARFQLPEPRLGPPVALPWRLWGDGPAPVLVRFAVIPPTPP